MDYIDKIKAARIKKGISQAQMAQILETTQPQYSKYERRIQELPVRHLVTICNELNLSSDYVLGIDKINIVKGPQTPRGLRATVSPKYQIKAGKKGSAVKIRGVKSKFD